MIRITTLFAVVAAASFTISQTSAQTNFDDIQLTDAELNDIVDVLLHFEISCTPDCADGCFCVNNNLCKCPDEERTLLDVASAGVSKIAKKSLKKFKKSGLGKQLLNRWKSLRSKLQKIENKAKQNLKGRFNKVVKIIKKKSGTFIPIKRPLGASKGVWDKIKNKVPIEKAVSLLTKRAFNMAKNVSKEIAVATLKAAAADWFETFAISRLCSCTGKWCRCCVNPPQTPFSCIEFEAQPKREQVRVRMSFGGKYVSEFIIMDESTVEEEITTCAELPEPWNIMDVCFTPSEMTLTPLSQQDLQKLKAERKKLDCPKHPKPSLCQPLLGKKSLKACFILSSDLLDKSWPSCFAFTPGETAKIVKEEFVWWKPAVDTLLEG